MLYFFLLLALSPSPACALMLDRPPLVNDYRPPACPLASMLPWDYYTLRLVDDHGVILCYWPAKNHLTELPCQPRPAKYYRVEVWLNQPEFACQLWLKNPAVAWGDVRRQCPDWIGEYEAGSLTIRGPFEIHPPVELTPACTLPQVDNSAPLATANNYKFLAGRLEWWGIHSTAWDWQNQFDEQIRAAADAVGVPARLLKAMIAREGQFWPLWTGSARENGWMQVTMDGADTALRHDPELFARYCPRAIWLPYCAGYDMLTLDQRSAVRWELLKDLRVEGAPLDAAHAAADDLWTYAHILRAYACQAQELYPALDVWQAAAVLYNTGTTCIKNDVICSKGLEYWGGLK